MELYTSRLTLRPATLDDAAFFLKILNEPSYHQNIGDRGVRTLEQAQNYLENRVLSYYQKMGFGVLIIKLKDRPQEAPIGFSSLREREGLPDIDLGYALLTEFRGKGYALEAAKRTLEHARDDLKFKRLVGYTNRDNAPSMRVLEKLGMKFEEMMRMPGEAVECKQFGMSFE